MLVFTEVSVLEAGLTLFVGPILFFVDWTLTVL